jgi:hypothetical protein
MKHTGSIIPTFIYNFVRSDVNYNLYACRCEGICNRIINAIFLMNKEKHKVTVFITYFSSGTDDLYIMSYCTEIWVKKGKEMLVKFFSGLRISY